MNNLFENMTDDELKEVYKEYNDWCKDGFIHNGTVLDNVRNRYIGAYSTSGLIIMELDFLRESAKRYFNER